MIYNFRFDRSSTDEILRRLRDESVMCQGWGGGSEADLRLAHDDFGERTTRYYKLKTSRIPSNLTRMRDFSNGDLLVTPHLPGDGCVAVHVVDGDYPDCYDYAPADQTHLNHRIRLRHSYGLGGNVSIYNALLASWYGKLQWLRLPILPIPQYEDAFRQVVARLEEDPSATLAASALDEYLEQLRSRVVQAVRAELEGISASSGAISFETVCERLITSGGYDLVRRHEYDRKGGDVDMRCVRLRSVSSPFETGEVVLLVQVKKHSGATDEEAVRQLLRMLQKEPSADGCVMSLAQRYTEEAESLARDHGIALLNGDDICRQMLGLLSSTESTHPA